MTRNTFALLLGGMIAFAGIAYKMNPPKWYEGGTLQQADFAHWKKSTDQNRLATAAVWTRDYMGPERAKIAGSDGLKRWSETLVTCVNAVAEKIETDFPAAAGDAARGCMAMMKYPHG